MLQPRKVKHRKQQRGKRRGKAYAGSNLDFGQYGLVTLETAWITARQIEAARVAITHFMKRVGKVWIRIFPDKPITLKPAETRMGKGKGAVDHHAATVRPGRILFEVGGNVTEEGAQEALRLAAGKLNLRTRFVKRVDSVKS